MVNTVSVEGLMPYCLRSGHERRKGCAPAWTKLATDNNNLTFGPSRHTPKRCPSLRRIKFQCHFLSSCPLALYTIQKYRLRPNRSAVSPGRPELCNNNYIEYLIDDSIVRITGYVIGNIPGYPGSDLSRTIPACTWLKTIWATWLGPLSQNNWKSAALGCWTSVVLYLLLSCRLR